MPTKQTPYINTSPSKKEVRKKEKSRKKMQKSKKKSPFYQKSGIFNQKNKEKSRKKIVGKIINQMIAYDPQSSH